MRFDIAWPHASHRPLNMVKNQNTHGYRAASASTAWNRCGSLEIISATPIAPQASHPPAASRAAIHHPEPARARASGLKRAHQAVIPAPESVCFAFLFNSRPGERHNSGHPHNTASERPSGPAWRFILGPNHHANGLVCAQKYQHADGGTNATAGQHRRSPIVRTRDSQYLRSPA